MWCGVGWGNNVRVAYEFAATSRLGWGGAGCGNNVQVMQCPVLWRICTCCYVMDGVAQSEILFWLRAKLLAVEKKEGHHFLSKGVNRMIPKWMWRQRVLPCSPKEMMETPRMECFLKKWKQLTATQQQWQMSSPIAARLEAALTNGRDVLTELCWYRPWWVSLRLLMAGYGKGPNRKAKMLIAWCISWRVYMGRPCQNWKRQHKNNSRCSIKPTKSSVCALEICYVHTVGGWNIQTPPDISGPHPPKAWSRTDKINQTPEDWHRSSTWGLINLSI